MTGDVDRRARRRSVLIFAAGVALAIGFASLLAAYDLWGGVPRSLWRPARYLFIGSGLCVVYGAVGFLRSYPAGQRLRPGLKALALLALLGGLGGGGLFAYYAARLETSRAICEPASKLPSRAAREQALAKGLGPLFPVIDPDFSCLNILRELRDLDRDGTCPRFLLDDARCRCGHSSWDPQSSPRCADGPSVCAYRAETDDYRIGCEPPPSY